MPSRDSKYIIYHTSVIQLAIIPCVGVGVCVCLFVVGVGGLGVFF